MSKRGGRRHTTPRRVPGEVGGSVDKTQRQSRPGGRTVRDRRGAGRPDLGRSVRRFVMPGLLAAAVVAALAIFVGSQTSGQPNAGNVPATRAVLGRADAAVVIREYGDFQCTSCGAFFRLIEPRIRAAYIDTGIARLEWHDFPWIGRESRDAANAARCAGDQGRFWDYHDLLYRSQSGENQGAFAKDRLKAMGVQLGLEPVAFNTCVDGDDHANAVAADFSDVRSKGFNSTPTFLVGSQRIVGAQPLEVFQAAIDAARAAD